MNNSDSESQMMVIIPERQLSVMIKQAVSEAMEAKEVKTDIAPTPERRTLHSMKELADFLGCSTVTAQVFKNDGRIPYRQMGRKVMFDTAEVLNAMNQPKKRARK